ncbi:hypothetical protein FGIG_06267 [Fasciola gigantica]|uniref:C2H2-type domain-containing protein n=1 Tax=Fasciola gigantica TaxID=46835 RepID=A0A504Y785_FASGI|nr:hypothetical protein FGIG_06267 [Fasciola gigantica]
MNAVGTVFMARNEKRSPLICNPENICPIDLSKPASTQSAQPKLGDTASVDTSGSCERSSDRHLSPLKTIHSNALPAKRVKRENSDALLGERHKYTSKFALFCEDCQVCLTSVTSLREHQLGKKHLSLVRAKLRALVDAVPFERTTDLDAGKEHSDENPGPKKSQFHPENELKDPFVRPADPNVSLAHFCHLCKVPLPDRSVIDAHIKGRRHQALMCALTTDRDHSNQSDSLLPPADDLEYPANTARSVSISIRGDDCRREFVENWVSDVAPHTAPTLDLNSVESVNQLDIKSVLKRVCLTQIISLLGAAHEVQLPASLSDEQLLAIISTKCTDYLCASSDKDDQSTTSWAPLAKLIQNNLLLCWCQQLTSLQS